MGGAGEFEGLKTYGSLLAQVGENFGTSPYLTLHMSTPMLAPTYVQVCMIATPINFYDLQITIRNNVSPRTDRCENRGNLSGTTL